MALKSNAARPRKAEPRQSADEEQDVNSNHALCGVCEAEGRNLCHHLPALGASLLDAPRLGDYQHLVLIVFQTIGRPTTAIDVINEIEAIAGTRPADAHVHNVIKKLATATNPICLERLTTVKRETGHTVPVYKMTAEARPLLAEYADHIEAIHTLIRRVGGSAGPATPTKKHEMIRERRSSHKVRVRSVTSGVTNVPARRSQRQVPSPDTESPT